MSWMAAVAPIASVANGGMNYFGQMQTNRSNETSAKDATAAGKKMAREQMAFQERMSNTAHQRGVEDLKAAGLNPLLAMQTEASSPQGASSAGIPSHVENAIGAGIGSARDFARLAMDFKKQKEELKLMSAQEKKTAAETLAAKANAKLNSSSAKSIEQNMVIKGPAERGADTLNWLFDSTGDKGSKYKTPDSPKAPPYNPLRNRP